MGSREKPLFDLNEPANEESDSACLQPQKAVPSAVDNSKFFTTSSSPRRTVNRRTFSHTSSVSGFQSSSRSKGDQKREAGTSSVVEKEEGEWSDEDGISVPETSTSGYVEKSQVKVMNRFTSKSDRNMATNGDSEKGENSNQEDSVVAPSPPRRRLIRGAEATHALKLATDPGKWPKVDQQKEVMLGKKRSRQTMFLNLEDVKQAAPVKSSTPKRPNFLPPITTRVPRESQPILDSGEKVTEDVKQVDQSCNEENNYVESSGTKSECNDGDVDSGPVTRSKRTNTGMNLAAEDKLYSDHRQSSLKQPADSRQMKNPHVPIKKPPLFSQNPIDSKTGLKRLPSRKPTTVTTQYQDTSVERLLREVTNEKFWQHPGPCIAEGIPAASCGGVQISQEPIDWKEIPRFL